MIKFVSPYTQFCLVGQPSDFVLGKYNRVKSFQLNTEKGIYRLKIPAKLHRSCHYDLTPDVTLEVKGTVLFHRKPQKTKLLIETIQPFSTSQIPRRTASNDSPAPLSESLTYRPLGQNPSQILLCQKAKCWQKGGETIYHKLQEKLQTEGLNSQVCVKKVGCMGHCQKGPNLITLPDGTEYHRFDPAQTDHLIKAMTQG
jgi:(2Fe-2S) ferredoxin